MKINTQSVMKNFDGSEIKDRDKPVTLRSVCVNALTVPEAPGAAVSGEEKLKRYMLAQRIYGEDEVDLTAEQVTLIKTLVSVSYGAIVSGQVWLLLDPAVGGSG